MSYLGNAPESVFTEMKYQDLTGGSGTSFTLNQAVSNPQEIEVFVNNVRQEPSAAYSVSGTTLTMTESVGASEDFYVIFQGMAQGSATHPATQSLEAASVTSTGAISGTSITGTSFVSSGNMTFADNDRIVLGTGSDIQMYHDGTYSRIMETGGTALVLDTTSTDIRLTADNSKVMGKFIKDGGVQLFHGNSQKFSTTSTGIDVTGVIEFGDSHTIGDDGNQNLAINSSAGENIILGPAGGFVNLADSKKLTFGTGQDLQIFHDGNNSFINNTVTGALSLKADDINLMNSSSQNMAVFTEGGAVTLYHNNAAKVATTGTGVNVTGTVTTDGLISDSITNESSNLLIASTQSVTLRFDSDNNQTNREFNLQRNASTGIFKAEESGDITFFADNGTTQGLRWDASTQRLGLGTTSPAVQAHIQTSSGNPELRIESTGANYATMSVKNSSRHYSTQIRTDQSNAYVVRDETAGANRFSIDTSGNLNVNQSSSTGGKLNVSNASGTWAATLVDAVGNNNYVEFRDSSGNQRGYLSAQGAGLKLNVGSAGGIDFSATSNASGMTSELLDDYEEGTWTPTIGGSGATYANQQGLYTKIGRYVCAVFDITVNARNSGSTNELHGFPFTANNGVSPAMGVYSGHISFYSGVNQNLYSMDMYIINGQTYAYFTGHTGASGNIANSLAVWQNSARILGTVHYFAS